MSEALCSFLPSFHLYLAVLIAVNCMLSLNALRHLMGPNNTLKSKHTFFDLIKNGNKGQSVPRPDISAIIAKNKVQRRKDGGKVSKGQASSRI